MLHAHHQRSQTMQMKQRYIESNRGTVTHSDDDESIKGHTVSNRAGQHLIHIGHEHHYMDPNQINELEEDQF
jgi:hypothetical protein